MNKRQIIFIALATFTLVVLLFFARNKPELPVKTVEEIGLEEKLDRAVELVQGGGNPMEGIGLLKEVLEEDPGNVDALMYLGVFSMQSGQFDKAEGRFTTIINNGGDFPAEAFYYLGVSQANLGKNEKAIENLTRFKELVDDESTIKEVEIYINNLKNQ